MNPKIGIADQFGWVQANFIVPKVTCSDSTETALSVIRPKGQLYSAAAFWVGLGGVNNKPLEQAGIQAWCPTKNSSPQYWAFWEMVPAGGGGGATLVPLYKDVTNTSHGKAVAIHAGDTIIVSAYDDSTNSRETGADYKPGQKYSFQIFDSNQLSESVIPLQSFGSGKLGADNTVEVVTEAINGGPWAYPDYTGIAHFRPVSYSQIYVGLNGGGYTYGIGTAESWKTSMYYVHGGAGGLLGFLKPQTLIGTGKLSSGSGGEEIGKAFTNSWDKA